MIVIKITVVTEVVIMTSFSKKHLNTLTTDRLSGQLFATLAMFSDVFPKGRVPKRNPANYLQHRNSNSKL